MPSIKANKAQEEAINTINGPVMLISCPGSGKTTTLLRRIHNMVRHGIPAGHILMVTFTRSAANDMRSRYQSMYPDEKPAVFNTIHAFCYAVLLTDGGYRRENIVSEHDMIFFILGEIGQSGWINDPMNTAVEIAGEISKIRNNYIDVNTYQPESCKEDVFRNIYHKYEDWKRRNHRYDMDDMLTDCKKLFEGSPSILAKYQRCFPYIQCDEYQDTNYVQRDILYMLSGKNHNLCVVGDDDQSIYAFRGARPEIMLNFSKDFPGCKVIHMDINYRSAAKVVEMADAVIQDNTERFPKKFISERGSEGAEGLVNYIERDNRPEEIAYCTGKITELHDKGMPYSDMAILYRTNDLVTAPSAALAQAKIPFYAKEKIRSIYDGWIYHCIECYIRLGLGKGTSQDVSYILNRPDRYFPARFFTSAEYSRPSFIRAAKIATASKPSWAYDAAVKSINNLFHCFGSGKLTEDMPASEVFKRLEGTNSIHFYKYLLAYAKQRNTDPDDLIDEYSALKSDASRCKTIRQWMDHASMASKTMESLNKKKDRKGVWLSTMHGAKGLEWKAVFIIDVNKDIVPHKKNKDPKSIEEERRLFYVAMTRAKDDLYILSTGHKESPFMQSLIAKKGAELFREQFKAPEIGSAMRHTIFGLGIVTDYSDGKITVEFAGEPKQFRWPDTVRNGLLMPVEH